MTLIGETLVQFGGKIGAHNLQKFGAEFRSARHEFPELLQVPLCQSCGAAHHHIHGTGQAAVGAHVPDQLTGSNCWERLGLDVGPRAKHIMDCGEPMPNDVGSVVANRIGASDTANRFTHR